MRDSEETGDVPAIIRGIGIFFQALALLAVPFVLLILVIPLAAYHFSSNCFEAFTAFDCMAASLYAYLKWSRKEILLLAAFAFGSYAFATAFWYPFSESLGRSFVYSPVTELGLLGIFLILIAAITIEFPAKEMPWYLTPSLIAVFLAVPLWAIWTAGDRGDFQPVHLALLVIQFLVTEQLFEVSIRRGVYRYKRLWAGICVWCLASMLYGIRETILLHSPLLVPRILGGPMTIYDLMSITGSLAIIASALILLGLFRYIRQKKDAESA